MQKSVTTIPRELVRVEATHTLIKYAADQQQAMQTLDAAINANSFLVYTKDQVDSITKAIATDLRRAITAAVLDSLKRDPDFRADIAAAMLREQKARPKSPP